MFKGAVDFVARIKGDGLEFDSFEFNPNEQGVENIRIEGHKGEEIRSTVHLTAVASENEGRHLAAKVNAAALNRITFLYRIAIEDAFATGDQFCPLNPPAGDVRIAVGSTIRFKHGFKAVASVTSDQLKAALEQKSLPGEHNFGLFRSALQSTSPVEAFMHLYNILLMLNNDRQAEVEAFVLSQEPSVKKTQHPLKPSGVEETVYTRLRNEFSHKRVGVNLEDTKTQMANCLGGLIAICKRAIELHP
jgi:hypothetical protein